MEDGDPDAHQPPAEGFVPGLARLQPKLGSINTFRNFRAGSSHISIQFCKISQTWELLQTTLTSFKLYLEFPAGPAKLREYFDENCKA